MSEMPPPIIEAPPPPPPSTPIVENPPPAPAIEIPTTQTPILEKEPVNPEEVQINNTWKQLTDVKSGLLWKDDTVTGIEDLKKTFDELNSLNERGFYNKKTGEFQLLDEAGTPTGETGKIQDLFPEVLDKAEVSQNPEVKGLIDYLRPRLTIKMPSENGQQKDITSDEYKQLTPEQRKNATVAFEHGKFDAREQSTQPTQATPEQSKPTLDQEQMKTELKNLVDSLRTDADHINKLLQNVLLIPNLTIEQQQKLLAPLVEKMFNGVDMRDILRADSNKLLTSRYKQNARSKMAWEKQWDTLTEEQRATLTDEIQRVQREQQLIEASGLSIDLSDITAEFEGEGVFADPTKQLELITAPTRLKGIMTKTAEDFAKAKKDEIVTWRVGKMDIPITKSGLMSFGKTIGTITAISTLLLLMQGMDEKGSRGMPMH